MEDFPEKIITELDLEKNLKLQHRYKRIFPKRNDIKHIFACYPNILQM